MLIGLTGHAGAGKDTVAAVLATGGWQSIAFADTLRREAARAWGVDERLWHRRTSKAAPVPQLAGAACSDVAWLRWAMAQGINMATPRSPRWALQQWGQYRRDSDPLYLVRAVAQWLQYQRQHMHQPLLVVTDVRMPNEAQALRRLGGHIVRVHRPGLPAQPAETAGDATEQHTDITADADVHNCATLAALPAEVWRVVQGLMPQPSGLIGRGWGIERAGARGR